MGEGREAGIDYGPRASRQGQQVQEGECQARRTSARAARGERAPWPAAERAAVLGRCARVHFPFACRIERWRGEPSAAGSEQDEARHDATTPDRPRAAPDRGDYFMRQELDRLRRRTFPSFAHAARNRLAVPPDEII